MTLTDRSPTYGVCVRVRKCENFHVLKSSIWIIKRLRPGRVWGGGCIWEVFKLPPQPAWPILISYLQYSIDLFNSSICILKSSKLCHKTSNIQLFCVGISAECMKLVDDCTFFYRCWLILWVFKWTWIMETYYIFFC
jgi:hypothetical protein